jgi:hypothetical protein
MTPPLTAVERLSEALTPEVLHTIWMAGCSTSAEEGQEEAMRAAIIAVLDPLVSPPPVGARTDEAQAWRCYHCDELFTDEREAEKHFGTTEESTADCRVGVKELRELEASNAQLRRENEELENDSRLWHGSEADRIRRIGHVQWWQEIDFREGEKLVLREKLAAKDAQIAQVLALCDVASEDRSASGYYASGKADLAQQVRALLTEAATGRAKP